MLSQIKTFLFMERTYEYFLEKNRILIFGVSGNASIRERIAAIYPAERIAEGEALYEQTRDAFATQKKEKQEGVKATRAFNLKKNELNTNLVSIREGIRYFFKNDLDTQKALLIEAEMPTTYAQWILFAESNLKAILANTDAVAKLSLLGHSEEQLQAYLAGLEEVEALRLVAEKEDGEGQQATVAKQQNYDELMRYCTDLRECLDLFYTGPERQKLEEVGIIVKS